MKKTSIYLTELLAARLRRIAEAEGRSQADVLRDALDRYPEPPPRRRFLLAGIASGDGSSVADVPEEELLEGFGRESMGE